MGHFGDVPQANLLIGVEKQPNITKHTFNNHKKCTTTQNRQKTKARFSRLLRCLAWIWRGPMLVSALHKSLTYLLRY